MHLEIKIVLICLQASDQSNTTSTVRSAKLCVQVNSEFAVHNARKELLF